MLRRIDGIVDLAVPLEVQSDALGGRVPVIIGGYEGTIGLPLPPASGIPSAGEVAFLQAPSLGSRPLPELTLYGMRAGRWGYIGSSQGHTFVEAVQIRIPLGDPSGTIPAQMHALGRAFDRWFESARDWICAWTGQPRHGEFDRAESHVSATIRVDGKPGLYGSGVTLSRVFFGHQPADKDQMMSAFYCASRGYALPLEHALLLRAKSDFADGNFRLAVINACTAAEVSLSAAVKAALNSAAVRDKTVTNIMKQSSGAVELFRLFVITGGTATVPITGGTASVSDDRVINELAKPRNEAAHAGGASTKPVAEQAIKIAIAIVKAAAPLPGPSDARRAARPNNQGP
jgi:hypothetical protein